MAKSPTEMSDEELAEALGEEIKPKEEAPPKEDKKEKVEPVEVSEEETPEEEAPEEAEPEEEAEEEKPPSRRENLRIQQILAKLKESQETKPAAAPAAPEAFDLATLEADPELIKKLQDDRQASNEAMYKQGIAQANSIRFHTRLEIDAPRIEQKYPQLDKTSDKFNPVLANSINTMYISTAGYDPGNQEKGIPESVRNPDLRYSDYVESIFELGAEIADEETQKTTKNIAKQAAKTGLRPDGTSAKGLNLNKHPADMSDEELAAAIAQDPAFR